MMGGRAGFTRQGGLQLSACHARVSKAFSVGLYESAVCQAEKFRQGSGLGTRYKQVLDMFDNMT